MQQNKSPASTRTTLPTMQCVQRTINPHCVFNFVPLAAVDSCFARHFHTSVRSKDGLP